MTDTPVVYTKLYRCNTPRGAMRVSVIPNTKSRIIRRYLKYARDLDQMIPFSYAVTSEATSEEICWGKQHVGGVEISITIIPAHGVEKAVKALEEIGFVNAEKYNF